MGSTDDRAAVSAANTAFYQAIEHGDLDLMGAIWDSDETVRCVHPGTSMLCGRSEVLRSWAVVMAGTPYIQFFITDVDVQVLGDVAMVTCNENVLTGVETPDGSPSGFAGGKAVATNVFRRSPQGWRLWVHHSSPVMAAADDPDDDEAQA
jgi:ketosteroid isomerase-like protein